MKNLFLTLSIAFLIIHSTYAQQVYYSDVQRIDARQMHFDIIGKINNRILIYTEYKNNRLLSVYDADMKLIASNELNSLANNILNVDFINYNKQGWIIYQFQQKDIVYCKAVPFDGNSMQTIETINIDSTKVNNIAKTKIYSLAISDDKQKIILFKINTQKEKNNIIKNGFTTFLFDAKMQLLRKTNFIVLIPERNNYLTDFYVDNQGNFLFTRVIKQKQEDRISNAFINIKPFDKDSCYIKDIDLKNLYLDDLKIKIDNLNKKYIFTSLYAKSRKGNIEGLYTAFWDITKDTVEHTNTIIFNDELRNDAKGPNTIKTAFNDYLLHNLIIKNDGGFIATGELFYTTSQNIPFNRWNYLYGYPYGSAFDYYSWYPYGSYYPYWRTNQSTQFHAENIIVLSVDNAGKLVWSNTIPKTQTNDETDLPLGYQIINTGNQLHFIFNQQERNIILPTDNSILPNGQLVHNPTLRSLERAYIFMPRYATQIGAREAIIPCLYNNYISFAKVEW